VADTATATSPLHNPPLAALTGRFRNHRRTGERRCGVACRGCSGALNSTG
jgi:hypothetical protein